MLNKILNLRQIYKNADHNINSCQVYVLEWFTYYWDEHDFFMVLLLFMRRNCGKINLCRIYVRGQLLRSKLNVITAKHTSMEEFWDFVDVLFLLIFYVVLIFAMYAVINFVWNYVPVYL